MKTQLYKANTRGYAEHGWLKSYHTFSFSNYHNPERMGFGLLRVLNDDWVAPAAGFGKHPHHNMEIVSLPLAGTLAHADSTGRNKEIKTGDVQIMSAGSGIAHSEFNHSKTEPVQFLQIWIMPKEANIAPRYEQKTFNLNQRRTGWQTVVSPKQNDDALWINQDAYFSLAKPEDGTKLTYTLNNADNGAFIMVLEGKISVEGTLLKRRDALGITDLSTINIESLADSDLLLIEVPMG